MQMKLRHCVVFLACAIQLFCLVGSNNAQSEKPPATAVDLFPNKSAVKDLSFQSEVEVRVVQAGFAEDQTLKPSATLRFKLNYYVKGKQIRYDFASSKVTGTLSSTLAHVVGTIVIVSKDQVKIKVPEQKPLTFPLQDKNSASIFDNYPNTGLPQFGAFAHDLLAANESDWQQAKAVGEETIDGINAKIYELKFPAPLLITPPHSVAAIRRFVDPRRGVTIREQQLTANRKVVQTTNYENFQKDDRGNWVSLFSRTEVAPTRTTISVPFTAEDGKRQDQEVTVPISGRIIERQYELVQGAFHLLSNFRMSDTNGNLIIKATFSDFIVNQGIDDSLFDFPKVELKTPVVGEVMPPFSFADLQGDLHGPEQWAGRDRANVLLMPSTPDNNYLIQTLQADKTPETLSTVVVPQKPAFATDALMVIDSERELLGLIGDKPILAQLDRAGWVRSLTPVADAKTLEVALQKKVETPPVEVGNSAPDFSIKDMDGKVRSLSELKGKKNLLLTFFPKCFTGGCKNHLTSINDHLEDFAKADTEVWAVSVDPADVQRDFAAMWKFQFPLLPDVGRNLSLLYGAAQNTEQLSGRMSVFIDKEGIVRLIDKSVNVGTHGSDTLKKMSELNLGK